MIVTEHIEELTHKKRKKERVRRKLIERIHQKRPITETHGTSRGREAGGTAVKTIITKVRPPEGRKGAELKYYA